MDNTVAVDQFCVDAARYLQCALRDEVSRGQAFIMDNFAFGDVDSFHDDLSFRVLGQRKKNATAPKGNYVLLDVLIFIYFKS